MEATELLFKAVVALGAVISALGTVIAFQYRERRKDEKAHREQERADREAFQKREDERRDKEITMYEQRIEDEKAANNERKQSFDALGTKINATVGDLTAILKLHEHEIGELKTDVTEIKNHIWPKDQNKIK